MSNIPSETEIIYSDGEITWYIDRNPDYSILNELNNINNENTYNNYINNIQPTIPFGEYKHNIIIICEYMEISNEDQNCCICMETREKNEICSLNCRHRFCEICVESCIKKKSLYTCSLCREPVEIISVQKTEIKEKLDQFCE
jgi:hypothetical protein